MKYPGERAGPGYAVCEIEIESQVAAEGKNSQEVVWFVASSEYPMERFGFDPAGNFGSWREVLDHSAGAIQLDRLKAGKVPLLLEHDRKDQIGAISSEYKQKDNQLRVAADFMSGAREQQLRRDVIEKKRRSASVGYNPKRAKLVEQSAELGDLWRVTLWEFTELSLVSVPANPMAGAANQAGGFPPIMVEVESDKAPVAEGKQAMPEERDLREKGEAADDGGGVETPVIEVKPGMEHAEIVRMCEAHGVSHRAAEWIEKGLSQGEVAQQILGIKKTRQRPGGQASQPTVDLPKEDRRRFSYARAIAMAATLRDSSVGVKFDGLEAEVHRHLASQMPQNYKGQGGVLVPIDLRGPEQEWRERQEWQDRRAALDTKTLSKGSEIVFDQPGELIELLRTRTAVIDLGARVLSGLTAPVPFPKQTSAVTAVWVGENPPVDVADSDLGLGLVTLQGKTLMASTAYARQLLVQASIDTETMVRTDIASVHGRAIDRGALHGLAAAGEPTGIYVAPDVQAKAMGGVPVFAQIIDAEALVADKNADEGSLGWMTTPLMAGVLKRSLVASAAGSEMIWMGNFREGAMGGYRARATNQISKTMSGSAPTGGAEHGMIFGNWNDLVVGLFGALELVVDFYSKKKRALIEVTSFQMADIILRHGESFVKSTGATIV